MGERKLSDSKDATRSREKYRRRKEQGICVVCGKEKAEPGYSMCPECRKNSRETQRLNREMFIRMGVCPQCRKNKIFPGEKRCPDCVEASNERWKKYTESLDIKEYNNTYARIRYQERKTNGICVQCGRRKTEPGKVRCKICSAKNNVRLRERRERMKAV